MKVQIKHFSHHATVALKLYLSEKVNLLISDMKPRSQWIKRFEWWDEFEIKGNGN